LLVPDAGQGRCLGLDITRDAAAIKARVGYMTQRFSHYEDLSIEENLDFVARVYGMPKRREEVDRALEELGLAARRRQLAGTLSGGWKQRLALAASLIHRPQLLLLDEPTAGVDPKARRDFWEEIHRLSARGLTVLITTHYMDEAERCHRLAYIANGVLLAEGTVEEVVNRAGLCTWEITGEDLWDLAERLRGLESVEQVMPFGNRLHVSGRDARRMRADIQAHLGPGHEGHEVPSGLEDVFISFMRKAEGASR